MFTWKPIYTELATTLLAWRSRQDELIAILHTANDKGVPVSTLQDEDKKGKKFPLEVIDPFTFFAFFNRGIKKEHRLTLLSLIKDKLGLQSPLPDDFEGIPVMFPQRTWFFSYQADRKPSEIDSLWDFAKAIVEQSPETVDRNLFAATLALPQVGLANLTMGMFWMRPDQYLAVDKRNRALFKEHGIHSNISDWPSYLSFLKQVKDLNLAPSWAELSQKAYQEHTSGDDVAGKRHWLFQAKPTHFNLVGALKAGAVGTWQVNQHRKEIHRGDRVVLWLSGDEAGVYGLGTVTSEVGEIQDSPAESAFQIPSAESNEPYIGVTLTVDSNLSDNPILKEEMLKHKHTKAAPMGRQGTNFPLTEKQFDAIASLTPAKNEGRRYWLYAPGEHARFWQECQDKSIMVIGYDELGDYRQFKSQAAVEQTLKKLWKAKVRPYNHSLAVWEFANVLKPGDIVITKLGRSNYLGYGIVDGPYDRDPSRAEYKNFRRVKWVKSGNWSADFKIVLKTLTDVTKYPDYVVELNKLIGITTDNLPAPNSQSSRILPALNIILYGPPGTGKTHQLRNHYMELFTDRQGVLSAEERASALVKDLAWWEVVALALLDSKDRKGSVAQILEHPLVRARLKLSANKNPRAQVWASLQSHTKQDCLNVKYTTRIDPLLFSKDESSVWSVDAQLTGTEVPELRSILQSFHNPAKDSPVVNRWRFTTFHQSFSYEDFVEGIKPQMEDRDDDGQLDYEVHPGIFKTICAEAEANPGKPYALFIDEINRGNVASIFGELITLIEEDKRLYAANALTPELPYSRKTFGVPPNLYIIGTMNTADRSVEALDTALRRRFTFVEICPDPSLIKYPASLNVDLPKLLTVINDRIEQLLDHDHCIGHAYFMGIKDLADLRSVFASKIIPLLREYFYGNPGKVGMVLGERFVFRKSAKTPFAVGSWGTDELDEKEVFTFADTSKLTEEDFQTIYAEPRPGI